MRPGLFRAILTGLLAASLLLNQFPAGALAEESPAPEASAAHSETAPAERTEPELPETEPIQPEETLPAVFSAPPAETPAGPGLYFGQLHAHSDLSDGVETPEAVYAGAAREGLDFFALTEHSHSLDGEKNSDLGVDAAEISRDWALGKTAARDASTASFVAIFGFEMSWPAQLKLGHMSAFATPGFQSWKQEEYSSVAGLERYYDTLSQVPGAVGQFCHPGTQYGSFSQFEYAAEADEAMALLELGDDLKWYIEALDKGWHLAPANNDEGRTVVYAQSLTEEGIYEGLRQRRVYATEDVDLEIHYEMEGQSLGSRLSVSGIGETADISVTLFDPTDSGAGLVEVMTGGGDCVARQQVESSGGGLTFSLPPKPGYYFLLVTQPDGDRAVTAPIWIEAGEGAGIASLTCETEHPVQNEEIILTLELYNWEAASLAVESLEILVDDLPKAVYSLEALEPGAVLTLPVALRCDNVGPARITARLTGVLKGSPWVSEAELPLSFRRSEQTAAILVDGSHGNAGLDSLAVLRQLAQQENIGLTVLREEATAEDLKHGRIFLVTAPKTPFSDAFLTAVADFAGSGGRLVVCGQGEGGSAELNRLLRAVGSTMEIGMPLTADANYPGGAEGLLYPNNINRAVSWCSGVSSGQTFRVRSGAAVMPGQGQWLVKDREQGPVLLAWEALSGGDVFVGGSLFLEDGGMEEPDDLWSRPYANRAIAQSLLNLGPETTPLSAVREARTGAGTLLRVRGYLTAGTAEPHNRFPDTLYLQDDTGGIALTDISGDDLPLGAPVEVTGYPKEQDGNWILRAQSWKRLDGKSRILKPLEGDWQTLLNPDENGGALVQVEGTCQEIYCGEDGLFAGCLLLDEAGNRAKIQVEPAIVSSGSGENELHKSIRKGRTVRAAGLLHVNEYGETVIRVRDCDEVVFVPPRIEPGLNPNTGDGIFVPFSSLLTASILLLLQKRRPPPKRRP